LRLAVGRYDGPEVDASQQFRVCRSGIRSTVTA
jgi:hypothetical protein